MKKKCKSYYFYQHKYCRSSLLLFFKPLKQMQNRENVIWYCNKIFFNYYKTDSETLIWKNGIFYEFYTEFGIFSAMSFCKF